MALNTWRQIQAIAWINNLIVIFRTHFHLMILLNGGSVGSWFKIDNQLSRNVLLFSCNPIGQLCLGDLCYSSRTVTESSVHYITVWTVRPFKRFKVALVLIARTGRPCLKANRSIQAFYLLVYLMLFSRRSLVCLSKCASKTVREWASLTIQLQWTML